MREVMMTTNDHLNDTDLSALIDDQVTREEQAEFRAHLDECEECTASYAMLKRTKQALRDLASIDIPRDFRLPAANLPSTLPSQQKTFLHYAISVAAIIVGLFFIFTTNEGLALQLPSAENLVVSSQSAPCTENACFDANSTQTKGNVATITPVWGTSTTLTPFPDEQTPTHATSTPPNTPTQNPPKTESTASQGRSGMAVPSSHPFPWELWGKFALGLALIGGGLLYWIKTRQIAK
jgi:hypothetical protein